MSWWVAKPKLQPGERLLTKFVANREQSFYRQVGGCLFLTDRRLIFQPNRFDRVLSGEQWAVELPAIEHVVVFPGSWRSVPLAGQAAGFRRRLEIRQTSGDVDLFVVNRVKNAVRRIQRELGPASQPVVLPTAETNPGAVSISASWRFPKSAKQGFAWALLLIAGGTWQLAFLPSHGGPRLPTWMPVLGIGLGLVILLATLTKCRPHSHGPGS
jgi:hypothetical protein